MTVESVQMHALVGKLFPCDIQLNLMFLVLSQTTFAASNTLQMEMLQNLCSNLETTLRDSSPPWQVRNSVLFVCTMDQTLY